MIRSMARRERNVIIWWGSFGCGGEGGGGATIGDLHAVENLSAALTQRQFHHVIATAIPLSEKFRPLARDISAIRKNLETIIFVCGPIVDAEYLRSFLLCRPAAQKFAVGVSVLVNHAEMNARFDRILPRDGAEDATFDLALARFSAIPVQKTPASDMIGLCLRGAQDEYGDAQPSQHERSGRLLLDAVRSSGARILNIDTVIEPAANTAAAIERRFAEVGIVATTRLHGALYALAYGRPAIAIDQIAGGAKVSAVLGQIGWPLVFRADQIDAATVVKAFDMAHSYEIRSHVERCREEAIARSAAALDRAAKLVAGSSRRRSILSRWIGASSSPGDE